jgi:hypothetical protein
MKKLFMSLLMLVIILFSIETFAATKLVWTAPTSGGVPTSYTLYYTSVSGSVYNKTVPSTQFEILLSALNLAYNVNYSFVVRANNAAGQSPDSNIVTYTAPGFTPPADAMPPALIPSAGASVMSIQ